MAGPLLKSLAKEVFQDLPPVKPEGLENALLRKGVKPEELKFMNIGVSPAQMTDLTSAFPQMLDDKGRIQKRSIELMPNARQDEFEETVLRRGYQGFDDTGKVISPEEQAKYPGIIPMDANVRWTPGSYKERIISFKGVSEGGVETSGHYPEMDYLMHTRLYDELVDGADTRVITEIQSDLHQQGLADAVDYGVTDSVDQAIKNLGATKASEYDFTAIPYGMLGKLASDMARRQMNLPYADKEQLFAQFETLATEAAKLAESQPDALVGELMQQVIKDKGMTFETSAEMPKVQAPWRSSWMRKGLENEILHAIEDGKQQIAIPVRNSIEPAYSRELLAEIRQADFSKAIAYLERGDGPDVREFRRLVKEALPEHLQSKAAAVDVPADLFFDSVFYSGDEITTQRFLNFLDSETANFGAETNSLQSLMRAEGVQKWYETSVAPTAQKLAKQMGAEYRTVNQDGIEYAVIDLSKGANTKGLTLYAGGAPLAAYMAFQEGYSEDEVYQEMVNRGFTEEEARDAIAKAPQVAEAKANDYTDDEIKAYFDNQQPKAESEETAVKDTKTGEPYVPKADTGDAKSDAAYTALVGKQEMSAEDIAVALQTVYPDMSSITTRMMAYFGDEDAAIKAQQTEAASVAKIQQAFARRGVQVEFIEGEWYAVNSQDNPDDVVRITPGMWDSFWAARGETGGAVLGGIAGGKAGAEATAGSPNPWVRGLAIAGGSIAGAVMGSVIGTELDYLRDAVMLSEEVSASVSAHKALTAAEASVLGDLVGLGVIKLGSSTLKGIVRAKDFIAGGNTEGAKQALRDTMFLREEEIDEVVAKLSKVVDTSAMSRAQQEITATALLLPGTQDLVRAAGIIDPKASRAVVRAINDRAADVLKTTSELAGEGAPVKLYEDLNGYVQQTKEYYTAVKTAAATAPRAKYYKFNIDRAALEPVYEQLKANIQDPATLEKFILQVNKARQHTNGRTFEDLIELRQLVNDFAFNRKITNGKAIGTLREVIDNLDGHIERGANFVFGKDKASEWVKEFGQAKAEYAKMKSLERNTLAKLVRRPGVQPELISKALLRYAQSVDGTYEHVMGIMPPKTRVIVEGDMLNNLAEKFSVGEPGAPRATHFPALAQELDKIQFLTPEARKVKSAIKELGEVFQNDVPLAESTGMMTVPKFQSYLTADPVVRAKFAAASTVFNFVKTLTPGEAGRQAALLRNTAKFLETPLNAKTLKEFTTELGDSVNLSADILKVQQAQGEAIAKGLDRSAARIKFYGDGNILSTSGRGAETKIPRHRIASKATAQAIADREAISVQDKKSLDLVLSKYGYKAVEYGSDKVRLIKP